MADDISDVPEPGAASAAAPSAPQSSAGSSSDPLDAKGVFSRKVVKKKLNKDWKEGTGAGFEEADVEVVTYNDGTVEEFVLDGPEGKRYPGVRSTYTDPQRKQQYDTEVKNRDAVTTTVTDINGRKFRIDTRKDLKGNIQNTFTDLSTGQQVPVLPVEQNQNNQPKTQLSKGGDGKTYVITIGPDGKMIGAPKDTGIPPEAKKDEVYNVPGHGLVRVDGQGNTQLVYAAPKDPNVKIEKDKNGRWVEIRVDADGKPSVTYIKPQGVDSATATPLGELPQDGEITKWLWDEQKKVDERVNSGQITKEEAVAEMEQRLKFANTLVAERKSRQETVDKDKDRESTDQRQRLTSAASMFNSIIPAIIKEMPNLDPGTGAAVAQGIMAMLQLSKVYAQQMDGLPRWVGNAPAGTPAGATIRPDGTIAPNPAPGPLDPAAQAAITQGLNGGLATLPGAAGAAPNVQTEDPATAAAADAATAAAQAGQALPNNGQAAQPIPDGVPEPGTVQPANVTGMDGYNQNAPMGKMMIPGVEQMADGLTGPVGPIPDWLQARLQGAVQPPPQDAPPIPMVGPGPLEGALDDIGANDPEWQRILDEMRRRGQQPAMA